MPWTFDLEDIVCPVCTEPVKPIGPLMLVATGDRHAIVAEGRCACEGTQWDLGLRPVGESGWS